MEVSFDDIKKSQEAHDKLWAEYERLHEINKELVEALRELRIISRLNVMEDQMRIMLWKTASEAIDKAEKE